MTASAVGMAIGVPVEQWPGRCYEIACRMLKANLVEGRACYGHYLGDTSRSELFSGRPFTHHGWIETPEGGIIDPTRWVFEDAEPYIFVTDVQPAEYDEGGNQLMLAMQKPVPEHTMEGKTAALKPGPASDLILALLKRTEPQTHLSVLEALWLANLSLLVLKDNAAMIYEALIEMDFKGLIPFDNRLKVLGQ